MKLRVLGSFLLLQATIGLKLSTPDMDESLTLFTKAYVVFVDGDDFIPGVQALAASLIDSNTTWPLIVILSSEPTMTLNSSLACLRNSGKELYFMQIPRIDNPTNHIDRYDRVYDKLGIFAMPLDRLVYLDADTVVLKNIDELLAEEQAPFRASPDCGLECFQSRFNSGVMAIRPDLFTYQSMLTQIGNMNSYDGSDQGFLNSYFKEDWKHKETQLPMTFNTLKRREIISPGIDFDEIHVIHNVGTKPWEKGDPDAERYPKSHGAYHRAMASYQQLCEDAVHNLKQTPIFRTKHQMNLKAFQIAWGTALEASWGA